MPVIAFPVEFRFTVESGASLTVSAVTLPGSVFSFTTDPLPTTLVAPHVNTFVVTVTRQTPGSGVLTVTHNGTNSPFVLNLSANGGST